MLLLSQADEKSLATLEQKAKESNSLLEMRDKNGILLAVGNSLKAFHPLKDRKGRPLYIVLRKPYIDDRTMKLEQKVVYDIKLDIYKGRKNWNFNNPFLQEHFNQKETYWHRTYENWNKSNSILKECNDVIINKVK